MSGVKDVRAAIDEARSQLAMRGSQTVLFIDEVHRFNKAQQDALLPAVENRWVSFIGATTENPFFSVVSPLLSRSLMLTLQPLTDADIELVISRALADERGLDGAVTLADDARAHLVRLAGGDARRALTYLEAAALGLPAGRRDHGRDPGAGRGPRDGPLRPVRRPALRRDQRVHQEPARQRRRRRAALPGPDDRGRGGPAVHRPAADRARERGRGPGRPDRVAGGGRGRSGGRVRRAARGAAQPGPGDDPHRARAEVQRGRDRDHRRRGRRAVRARRRRAKAPARRQLPRRGEARPRQGLRVPAQRSGRNSPRSSTRPTRSAASSTTSRPGTGSRPGTPSDPSASGRRSGWLRPVPPRRRNRAPATSQPIPEPAGAGRHTARAIRPDRRLGAMLAR